MEDRPHMDREIEDTLEVKQGMGRMDLAHQEEDLAVEARMVVGLRMRGEGRLTDVTLPPWRRTLRIPDHTGNLVGCTPCNQTTGPTKSGIRPFQAR